MSKKKQTAERTTIRCAIYTRVSTTEQADKEYNSLEAQRETCEAYVASQKHAGWECVATRYDDAGFTGANTDRPAFQRLMADIEAGLVDAMVCYKLDRISRSILDFANTLRCLEQRQVALVSVTQCFDTSAATGKLMMNILMSFAEFERQIISERTRDKIASARRKGKWSGGMPVLGYTVVDTKLVVDPDEAQRVRQIFELYAERKSLLDVARELNNRSWRTKCWTTKKGLVKGGLPFHKGSLYQLLTNPVYVGMVRYKDEVHPGEHEAVVKQDLYNFVQKYLSKNGSNGGSAVRNKYGALLRGILRCGACDCAMSHSYSSRGNKRYRYYACTHAQKNGWKECPSPSVPAGEIERFVVDQIKSIGRDPDILRETILQARRQVESQTANLKAEQRELEKRIASDQAELKRALDRNAHERAVSAQDRLGDAQRRLSEVGAELATVAALGVTDADVREALAEFDQLWESLVPREQARVIGLLIERVTYDGKNESVALTFHANGIRILAGELRKEDAA